MKKITLLLSLFVLFSFSTIYAQELALEIEKIEQEINIHTTLIDTLKVKKEALQLNFIRKEIKRFVLPKVEEGETLIEHKALMLVYSEKHEQAKWVAHVISPEIIKGGVSRTNDFRIDPKVKTASAEEKDYFLKYEEEGEIIYDGFGYDRGHLAPSADFRWSQIALSESYFYSNMSPQLGDFNREGWAELEGMLRGYVYEHKVPLYVITAPILSDDLTPIERSINKVSIPKQFYKIVYDKVNQRAIAFLLPHKKFEYPIEYYALSIDSLESLTGIDYFFNLEGEIEQKIESQTDYQPFLPDKERNDVAPLKVVPKKSVNTIDAKKYINASKKVTVCGTVVSTHKSKKGHVFINLDKSFPNTIFSLTIWASDAMNFSYKPEEELKGKKICVTGNVVIYNKTPAIYVTNEKQIKFLE
jgi:endonuclease G